MRNTPRVHQVISLLKKEFGRPAVFVHHVSTSTDPSTGRVTSETVVHSVNEAVVLPSELSLFEKRSISLISSNKQIVQGGQYQGEKKKFIFDADDIPKPHMDDWIIYERKKYAIASVELAEENAGWIIDGHAVGDASQIVVEIMEDFVSVSQGVTG